MRDVGSRASGSVPASLGESPCVVDVAWSQKRVGKYDGQCRLVRGGSDGIRVPGGVGEHVPEVVYHGSKEGEHNKVAHVFGEPRIVRSFQLGACNGRVVALLPGSVRVAGRQAAQQRVRGVVV